MPIANTVRCSSELPLGYTNALIPVIARPTISVLISRVPSYE